MVQVSADSAGHGLRLLSLDGGGIRGMSTLLILKRIMYLIQRREGLSEMPLPCEYFDLIGGTSSGGIIAIMLGRLRMSIDDAIDCYGSLSRTIFRPTSIFGPTKFDHEALEEFIKDTVKEYIGGENEKMLDNRENACRTFVCARRALNLNSGHPHLFRTYTSPVEDSYNCKIWEATRATSAAPDFFERIYIGGYGFPEQPYIDGGLGLNNPIRQVLRESNIIFENQSVACIISIGTGQKSTIEIPNPSILDRVFGRDSMSIHVAKATLEIATDCEVTEQQIAQQFQAANNLYFRFNVDQGMQLIDLADFDKVQNVAAHTDAYMQNQDVHSKLKDAVSVLCERRETVSTSKITGSVVVSQTESNSVANISDPRTGDGVQKNLSKLFNNKADVVVVRGYGRMSYG